MFATVESNIITGTDATQTGRIPVEEDFVQVFVDDLYRSSKLVYNGDVKLYDVNLRRYGISDYDMSNAWENPEQSDFFQFGYKGMENMSTAAGLPLFASKPHCLDGDPILIDSVMGLHPDREKHDTYVDFEPITGVAFRAAKRLQLMTPLEDWKLPTLGAGVAEKAAIVAALKDKLPLIGDLVDCLNIELDWSGLPSETGAETNVEGYQPIYLPYGWVSEEMSFTEEDSDEFCDTVYYAQDLSVTVSFMAMCLSGILGCCLLWTWGVGKVSRREERKDIEMTKLVKNDKATGLTNAMNNNTSIYSSSMSPSGSNNNLVNSCLIGGSHSYGRKLSNGDSNGEAIDEDSILRNTLNRKSSSKRSCMDFVTCTGYSEEGEKSCASLICCSKESENNENQRTESEQRLLFSLEEDQKEVRGSSIGRKGLGAPTQSVRF